MELPGSEAALIPRPPKVEEAQEAADEAEEEVPHGIYGSETVTAWVWVKHEFQIVSD